VCPISTEWGTRRVHLVRGGGVQVNLVANARTYDVSSLRVRVFPLDPPLSPPFSPSPRGSPPFTSF
jgi:hypothetical protein